MNRTVLDFLRVLSLPITVTIKEQFPTFPAISVDVQFTVVSPTSNTESDVGKQVTLGLASTLSVAVVLNTTLDDELSPTSVFEVTSGQSSVGASSSALKKYQIN